MFGKTRYKAGKKIFYVAEKPLKWPDNRFFLRYEWHDEGGQWFRSYGNELREFDADGLMRKRFASINDAPIAGADRRVF